MNTNREEVFFKKYNAMNNKYVNKFENLDKNLRNNLAKLISGEIESLNANKTIR